MELDEPAPRGAAWSLQNLQQWRPASRGSARSICAAPGSVTPGAADGYQPSPHVSAPEASLYAERPFALSGFPNLLNVGKIAHPARRKFRCNQVVPGNEEGDEAAL